MASCEAGNRYIYTYTDGLFCDPVTALRSVTLSSSSNNEPEMMWKDALISGLEI